MENDNRANENFDWARDLAHFNWLTIRLYYIFSPTHFFVRSLSLSLKSRSWDFGSNSRVRYVLPLIFKFSEGTFWMANIKLLINFGVHEFSS